MAAKSIPQRRNAAPPKPLTLCTVPLDASIKTFSPTTIPSITYQPASSTSTVNTYNSTFSSSEDPSNWPPLADDSLVDSDDEPAPCNTTSRRPSVTSSDDAIPPMLPLYRAKPASAVRPSDPRIFSSLFPSMDRLSIRHDDQSNDGNMSLRVDTAAPGSVTGFGYGSRKKYSAVQLFHLRMHDLARRDFSLRRYGRNSGREVCSAKRAYAEPSAVSTALRSVKAPFRRSGLHSHSGFHSGTMHSAHHLPPSPSFRKRSVGGNACSAASTPASSSDNAGGAHAASSYFNAHQSGPQSPALRPIVATDTIKLEFSNYAHVDVRRCYNKRYEFEWWGHSYAWRRDVDKTLGGVSFHLIRDGHGAPIAHVVPEMRSPNQVDAEEDAGGWIPPCYMWISDKSIIDAVTDVADVIVATGLIALVDDSIKERWPKKTAHSSRRSSITNASTPRTSIIQSFFRRSRTDNNQQSHHHQQQEQEQQPKQKEKEKQNKRYSQQPQQNQLRPSHEQRRHSVNAPVFKTPVY